MEQDIYVDALLVTNYIVNMLLIMCTGRLSGRVPKRRRIVAAALFGGAASLTIFLPLQSLAASLFTKLVISAAIVVIAFSFVNTAEFLKQFFLFFAVNFSFAGVMLGLLLIFAPGWLIYNNGIVYFDISPTVLILSTAAAYVVLTLAGRLVSGNKLTGEIHDVIITISGKSITLSGLVDTGNRLREPFSNSPVVVCHAKEIAPLLPDELVLLVTGGKITGHSIYSCGATVRLVPYSNVGGSGILPSVKADYIVIKKRLHSIKAEQVYIGLSDKKIGDDKYSCLLNPDLIGIITKNKVTVVPDK